MADRCISDDCGNMGNMGTDGKSPRVSLRTNQKLQETFRLFSAPQRPVPLRRSAQLLTNNAAKRFLERLIRAFHLPAQTFVDERLIVASSGAFHLVANPLQNLIVEANGDARLPAKAGSLWSLRMWGLRLEISGQAEFFPGPCFF